MGGQLFNADAQAGGCTAKALRAKAGNSEARAQMIQGNLRLVLSVVQSGDTRNGLPILLAEGAFGLAAAAPRSPYRHLELCGIAIT